MSKARHVGRKDGGRTPSKVYGNPNVFKEAGAKKGGRVKRADGGKVMGLMTGGTVGARLDRPGRKKGGRVGSNNMPLSTAHNVVSAEKRPGDNTDSD